VHARLRRPSLKASELLRSGSFEVDPPAHCARFKDEVYQLTHNELRLLTMLLKEPGKVCSREELFVEIFESDDVEDTRRLEVLVSRLRRKLGPAGQALATVWGAGYRFEQGLLP
jgi:DNA-binding response OmpR family regulator